MIRRRDKDSFIGVATIFMAIFAFTLLTITNASSILIILVIAGISCLAGLKIADLVIGPPLVSQKVRNSSRFIKK